MPDGRLPTHVWLDAELRRCSAEGIGVVVIHKGEKMGGTVMLKLYQHGVGCRVFSQMRDLDGRLAWYPAHKEAVIPESDADERIRRAVERDPDLWVVEVESRDGTIPFGDV